MKLFEYLKNIIKRHDIYHNNNYNAFYQDFGNMEIILIKTNDNKIFQLEKQNNEYKYYEKDTKIINGLNYYFEKTQKYIRERIGDTK